MVFRTSSSRSRLSSQAEADREAGAGRIEVHRGNGLRPPKWVSQMADHCLRFWDQDGMRQTSSEELCDELEDGDWSTHPAGEGSKGVLASCREQKRRSRRL